MPTLLNLCILTRCRCTAAFVGKTVSHPKGHFNSSKFAFSLRGKKSSLGTLVAFGYRDRTAKTSGNYDSLAGSCNPHAWNAGTGTGIRKLWTNCSCLRRWSVTRHAENFGFTPPPPLQNVTLASRHFFFKIYPPPLPSHA